MNAKNRIGRAALLVVGLGLAVSAPLTASASAEAKGGPTKDKAILKQSAILKSNGNKAILRAIL